VGIGYERSGSDGTETDALPYQKRKRIPLRGGPHPPRIFSRKEKKTSFDKKNELVVQDSDEDRLK